MDMDGVKVPWGGMTLTLWLDFAVKDLGAWRQGFLSSFLGLHFRGVASLCQLVLQIFRTYGSSVHSHFLLLGRQKHG